MTDLVLHAQHPQSRHEQGTTNSVLTYKIVLLIRPVLFKLLGGQIGLDDFIFAHRKGK